MSGNPWSSEQHKSCFFPLLNPSKVVPGHLLKITAIILSPEFADGFIPAFHYWSRSEKLETLLIPKKPTMYVFICYCNVVIIQNT